MRAGDGGHAGASLFAIAFSSSIRSRARLPAIVGIFGQASRHDAVQRGRCQWLERGDWRRIGMEDRANQRRGVLPLERPLPGRHLVDRRAEREDVAPDVGLTAFELLGCHVGKRAEHAPSAVSCASCGRDRRQCGYAGTRLQFREAEVKQLGAGPSQHDVAGLEIAMDQSSPVRVIQAHRRSRRRSAAPPAATTGPDQTIGERLPLEMLHHEETDRIGVELVDSGLAASPTSWRPQMCG